MVQINYYDRCVTSLNFRHKRNEALSMADNKSREVGKLHVKVEVDVSEALTGLKALQREAREATKVLRELEAVSRNAE